MAKHLRRKNSYGEQPVLPVQHAEKEESRQLSIRIGFGIAALTTVVAYGALTGAERLIAGSSEDELPNLPHSSTQVIETQQIVEDELIERFSELEVAPEVKTNYSLQELIDYARNTEFTTATDAEQNAILEQFEQSLLPYETEQIAAEAMLAMTGRKLRFNIDPHSGEPLLDTRPDPSPEFYTSQVKQFLELQSVLPRGLAALPVGGYNIFHDYQTDTSPDGRESINKNLAGTVHGSNRLLSLDIDSAGSLSVLLHELVHAQQFEDLEEYETGEYARLRAESADRFGSVSDMLVEINKLDSGEIDPEARQQAWELAFNESKGGNVLLEDAASTLDTVVSHGLLPETDIPIIEHLRAKQEQSLNDLSKAAGADIGAMLAYIERFGTMHPQVLVELADAGILESISALDGSGLSEEGWSPTQSETRLHPGSHVINIGNSISPEYLLLHARDARHNSGNYTIEVILPEDDELVNLRDLAEEAKINDESMMDGEDEEIIDPPYSHPDPRLEDLVQTLLPGVLQYEIYTATTSRTYGEDGGVLTNYSLEVTDDTIARYIDPSRLVGMINGAGNFETFDPIEPTTPHTQ